MAGAESAQSGCLESLTTELGVLNIDTHSECIRGRAVLGLDLDVCALDATSEFIANGVKAASGQRTCGTQPYSEKAPLTTAASTSIAEVGYVTF